MESAVSGGLGKCRVSFSPMSYDRMCELKSFVSEGKSLLFILALFWLARLTAVSTGSMMLCYCVYIWYSHVYMVFSSSPSSSSSSSSSISYSSSKRFAGDRPVHIWLLCHHLQRGLFQWSCPWWDIQTPGQLSAHFSFIICHFLTWNSNRSKTTSLSKCPEIVD